ncbi:MAG: hypothetical protein JWP89_5959 [Schlesneria sp.]|nr:hypothetical protein [Schlesneria sp.]
MVMFSDRAEVSGSDVCRELSARWPSLTAPTEIDAKENIASFSIGSAMVFLAPMPAPIPWSDLEGPCATSLLWKNAAQEVKRHQQHLLVTIFGELDPIEYSTLLTQVTAAVLAASPSSIGVYWGGATLVIPKPIFIDFAMEVLAEGPPLHIWVDFRVGSESDQTSSGFTAGMTALGHMELEAKNTPEAPGELRERLMGLAGYLLDKGPVIKNGDTIGEDANERIRVVYSKSAFGHDGQVMRLEYGPTSKQKPWWKMW